MAGRRRSNSAVGAWSMKESWATRNSAVGGWKTHKLKITNSDVGAERRLEYEASRKMRLSCCRRCASSLSFLHLGLGCYVDPVLSRTCVPYGRGNAAHERDKSGQFSHSFDCNIVLAIRFVSLAAPCSLCAGDAGNLPHVCWQKTLRRCLLGWLVA